MRRLSGEGAGFLSLELPTQPMNTMILAVLRSGPDAAGTVRPLDREYVRDHMARRLGDLPALRWRVHPVPFGLHHHVAIEDPGFDLDSHVREATLPAPGRPEQLDRLCASLAEHALDRHHPLWQLTLVHGLEGGGQAVVLRIHHCLMDGFATVNALSYIFSGEDHEPVAPASSWLPEAVPRPSRLLRDAVFDQGRAARHLPALIGRTRRNWAAVKAEQLAGAGATGVVVPKSGDTPATSINRAFAAERTFARTALPLADLKAVKAAAGVSVNDVGLAVVAGALRAYLVTRHDLPVKALVASVPVGLEVAGAPPRTFGNRFSGLNTSLATDVVDPWERLLAISAVTAESKRLLTIFGPAMLPDWLEYLPPAILGPFVRVIDRKRRAHPDKVDVNVVVSNVRGPEAPWRLGRALVDELYLAGPPDSRVGVDVVLWDYGDSVLFSVLSFADSVSAPAELAMGFHEALTELVSIAAGRARRAALGRHDLD